MPSVAVHFDYATVLVSDEVSRRRVAKAAMHPCLAIFEKVSTRRRDRTIDRQAKSEESIQALCADPANHVIDFDTRRGHDVASGVLATGTRARSTPLATRHSGYLAFRQVPDVDAMVEALCELAAALDCGAGFVAAEPDYLHAQHAALSNALPKLRVGMSERRRIERRGRHWHDEQLAGELAGPEWGTFLGAGHLAKIDLEAVRSSGVFERVISVTPRLAFLQLTSDPADDLRDDFELKLQAARGVLAPLLMDLSDVNLRD